MSEAYSSLIFKLLGEGQVMVYQYLKIVLCESGCLYFCSAPFNYFIAFYDFVINQWHIFSNFEQENSSWTLLF